MYNGLTKMRRSLGKTWPGKGVRFAYKHASTAGTKTARRERLAVTDKRFMQKLCYHALQGLSSHYIHFIRREKAAPACGG
jgi:hypothetical protein